MKENKNLKNKKRFFSKNFFIGLIAGIAIVLAGMFIYQKLNEQKLPPTNNTCSDPPTEYSLANCRDFCKMKCANRAAFDQCNKICNKL